MAVIDLVKWEASPTDFVWKFPSTELATWTQLIVNETQEALFVKEGRIQHHFKEPGRYTLDTKNLPFLISLYKLPFGGRSPFTAEIWFVNKTYSLDLKWGTPQPIQLRDPEFDVMVPVRACGQFGVHIVDGMNLYKKLVGTLPQFNKDAMGNYFKGIIIAQAKDLISKALILSKISILDISAHLLEISRTIQTEINKDLEAYGVELVNFLLTSIDTPEEGDSVIKHLQELQCTRLEYRMLGTNYAQKRSFDVMEAAAGNSNGSASQFVGAGLGMGMGVGMGQQFGNAMTQVQPLDPSSPPPPPPTLLCPKCQTQLQPGTKFCSNCGSPLVCNCSKCNTALPPTAKFCPECGTPRS